MMQERERMSKWKSSGSEREKKEEVAFCAPRVV